MKILIFRTLAASFLALAFAVVAIEYQLVPLLGQLVSQPEFQPSLLKPLEAFAVAVVEDCSKPDLALV